MRDFAESADRAPFPAGYRDEPRYLGYRDADLSRPYAEFMAPATAPVQPHVLQALAAGMAPPELAHGVDEVADRLARPGHERLETGWTRLASGVVVVAVRTAMPGCTAAMWDWWFAWHSTETARYKLWHPDAHRYAAIAEDRRADRGLTDRQRYVGNVSYVDEYIGGRLQRLAIRFLDPERLGLTAAPGTTHVCARVTLSALPVAIGWLVHQVRPTDDGVEMRSRFFLNDVALLDLPRRALPGSAAARLLGSRPARAVAPLAVGPIASLAMPRTLGADLLHHCAAEMNHLAGFLPRLHQTLRDLP